MNKYTFKCIAPNGVVVEIVEVSSSNYWSAKYKAELFSPGYDKYVLVNGPSLFQLIHNN